MDSKEMEIILAYEERSWNDLEHAKNTYGEKNPLYINSRSKWVAVFDLCCLLGLREEVHQRRVKSGLKKEQGNWRA